MQDQRVRAVAAAEWLGGSVALITITAPGDDYFGRRGEVKPGLRKEAVIDWNRSARRRWRAFHLWASRMLRRYGLCAIVGWRLLFRSWEFQRRGLLHNHLVLPYHTEDQRAFTDLYVIMLHRGASKFGFGYVLGGDTDHDPSSGVDAVVKPADGAAAAGYVCKYLSSIGTGKQSMADVAKRTAKRGSVLYVANGLTRLSGVTMTTLRARRRIATRYRWASASAEAWRTASVLDAVQRGRAPLTRQTEDSIRTALLTFPEAVLVCRATGQLFSPTRAPLPRSTGLGVFGPARQTRVLLVVLASVLLGDSDRPWLGSVRTSGGVAFA